MVKEQCPNIQPLESSSKMVCFIMMYIENIVLLDSGSSISSISQAFAISLHLTIIPTSPIRVVFGDKKEVYDKPSACFQFYIISLLMLSHSSMLAILYYTGL